MTVVFLWCRTGQTISPGYHLTSHLLLSSGQCCSLNMSFLRFVEVEVISKFAIQVMRKRPSLNVVSKMCRTILPDNCSNDKDIRTGLPNKFAEQRVGQQFPQSCPKGCPQIIHACVHTPACECLKSIASSY